MTSAPSRAAIEAAIKTTEYKYFGDYEMSDDQRAAVDVLVECGLAIAALEASSRQEERLSGMREALERIANWEMPETGDFYDIAQTRPVSYGAAWGSNGERDVIIGYARAALEPPHAKDAADG